jgi:hypothetical protein
MALSEKEQQTFRTIVEALAHSALVLVAGVDRRTGEHVACLCAALSKTGTMPNSAADVSFLPLARLFAGDPNVDVVLPNSPGVGVVCLDPHSKGN